MSEAVIANLEKLLGGPRDGALLRYSLGNEYLKAGRLPAAAEAFRQALAQDPKYSAAWKMLGKTLHEKGEPEAALSAYQNGIAIAEQRGDIQAAKEMHIFAKRLRKALGESVS